MSLYNQLIKSLSQQENSEKFLDIKDRPLIAFGPESSLGIIHLQFLKSSGANFILAVDDYSSKSQINDIPVIRSAQFLEILKTLPKNSIAIDFSQQDYAMCYFRELAHHANIEQRDVLQALACFNAPSVYENTQTYRENTLKRADDWLKLSQRLGDDLSRETLYGVLLQRLEYDRHWIKDIKIGGHHEYFGYADSNTFVLGKNEDFVDCGAHRGTIIQKLLSVTSWNYSSLHAFEPDADNFSALKNITPWPLENFHAHPYAVADKPQTLRFLKTGTVSSHITQDGNVTIDCVTIDSLVEKASLIKFDVEGFEARALRGASGLLERHRPRLAVAGYHYATDILDIAQTIDELAPGYTFYLRHHFGYFYDTILYATPRKDWLPLEKSA